MLLCLYLLVDCLQPIDLSDRIRLQVFHMTLPLALGLHRNLQYN